MLFTDEEFASMNKSKPGFAKYDWDFSGSLGGPIIKDKLWFYGTVEYLQNEYTFTFDPVTLEGKTYSLYPIPVKNFSPFLKLTTQLNKDMRASSSCSTAPTAHPPNPTATASPKTPDGCPFAMPRP